MTTLGPDPTVLVVAIPPLLIAPEPPMLEPPELELETKGLVPDVLHAIAISNTVENETVASARSVFLFRMSVSECEATQELRTNRLTLLWIEVAAQSSHFYDNFRVNHTFEECAFQPAA